MKVIKILSIVISLVMATACSGPARKSTNTSHPEDKRGVEMSVYPERNGGAPDALLLTIKNNTGQFIQFGAGYSVERFDGKQWVNHELGNFAVIAIMYGLQAGDSGEYSINLFSDRVKYPEGDYRLVKRINVGESDSQPFYANFKIIEPR